MSSNCNDMTKVLTDPNCKSSYTDAYNTYINQMNTYCSQSDNLISNTNCNNFIENDPFIKNTNIQKTLSGSLQNLCANNINTTLNDICIDKYKRKPDLLIQQELTQAAIEKQAELDKQAAIKKQAELDKQATIDKQAVLDKQAAIDKRAALDKQAAIDKQTALDKQTEENYIYMGIGFFILVVIFYFIYIKSPPNMPMHFQQPPNMPMHFQQSPNMPMNFQQPPNMPMNFQQPPNTPLA